MPWKDVYSAVGITPADLRFLLVVQQVERIRLVCSLTTASDAIEFEQNTPNHVHVMKQAIEMGEWRQRLSLCDIRSWHKQMFPFGGEWRTSDVRISGSRHRPLPHSRLQPHMLLFTDNLAWWLHCDNDPYISLAHTHLEFTRIHPFTDGNGRVSRLILNYSAAYLRLPPIAIQDREQYIDLLEKCDELSLAQFIKASSVTVGNPSSL